MAVRRDVVADPEELAKTAAQRLLARIDAQRERIAVCLTGGSGPKRLFELLAGEFATRIPWSRVHWFIGDERFVPLDDELSNMGTARRMLLDGRAPAENIHGIPTELATLDDAALTYQRTLQAFYGADQLDPARPLFDLVLMGLGPDGHTASLFPDSPASAEQQRWVVGVETAHVSPFVPRVTLTLPTLASCREMLFLVGGAEKRAVLSRVLAGEDLPATRAHSLSETVWLIDRAARPEEFDA
ncbi:6-phosphogluconolactonase [Rhodopseudomonas palustris]|uniref:6-phosphogluconolactonase n=1 Tax=Rhodopseudomonas palustris (strain BisB18) TaxID=316056 RepID=Q210H8_RHOPB